MRVYVFGANGMLGHQVVKELSSSYHIIPVTRSMFDAMKDDLSLFLHDITPNDIIINCIGAIPQKSPTTQEYIQLNTLFPLKLEELAKTHGFIFIHITTDCVFDGKKGGYIETDAHTATDIYGITKSLGEPKSACVIRTSIIGEEITGKKSLLEWVKSQSGTTAGYTNHLWNGVTCQTLSKIIREMIDTKSFWTGIRHIHSPDTVTKYQLCNFINEVYNLNLDILQIEHISSKNMTLYSIYPIIYDIETIQEQIKYLKNNQVSV